MSRRLGIYVAIALVGSGVAWFFSAFDRTLVTERVPPSGEARVREFLAAERFAERMGLPSRELRSLPELDRLAPGILLVPGRRASIDAVRAAQLLAWAQAGNHLVAEAELPGVDDALLDALQVKRVSGTGGVSLEAPGLAPAVLVDGKVLSFARGKGRVTVAASLQFARNAWIGAPGNAELLWRVIELTPAKQLQVFFHPERLSLSGFLLEHAARALVAAGALLALWLWRIAPRFGPVAPDAPPARRRLLDHLRASGRYSWAQGLRASLVVATRDAALRRVARSQPDFPAASKTEKEQRLAALAGMRSEEAAQFIAAGGAMRGHDFIRVVQRAQRVHAALDRGA